MDLNRALTYIQLMCDDLVDFPKHEMVQDLSFSWRQSPKSLRDDGAWNFSLLCHLSAIECPTNGID